MNLRLSNASNIVFILPIIIGLLGEIWLGVVLNIGLLAASFSYHNSHEKNYLRYDQFFSYVNIFYNLYLCYLFGFDIRPFGLALIFLGVGMYCYMKKKTGRNHYDIYHMVWHLSCAAITTCCYLGYLLYR